MKLDARALAGLEERTGFPTRTLERVLRLSELAQDMARHPFLGKVLALKGGTALNLFFGTPRRLSVDLDFNYVGVVDRAKMLQDRPVVERAVQELARSRGYRIQTSKEAHAGRKIFLGYRGMDGNRQRVEVDLNFLHRQGLLPLARRSMWNPTGMEAGAIPLMSLEEICAGKLCALLDRGLPRDLFDAAFLSERAGGTLQGPLFRTIFIAYSGGLPKALYTYGLRKWERLSERALVRQLHPMLASSFRPALQELLERAQRLVAPLLSLKPQEREFVDLLQLGELRAHLLCPDDPALEARIQASPVLLWKVHNARQPKGPGNPRTASKVE